MGIILKHFLYEFLIVSVINFSIMLVWLILVLHKESIVTQLWGEPHFAALNP